MLFYFDYLSPYAYVAWFRVKELCERRGLELEARPVLLAGLLKHWGQLGPAEIAPKRRFTFRDAYRRAHDAGLPLVPPATHPFNPLTALRASLPEAPDQHRVIDVFYRAAWGEGREMSDPAVLAEVLDAAGLDGAARIEATRKPEVKARLKELTTNAISEGVFGVPTILVGGELFFGQDRLHDVERFLDGNDPAASLDERALERAPSATRT